MAEEKKTVKQTSAKSTKTQSTAKKTATKPKPKEPAKQTKSESKIDVRVFAVPERKDNVKKLQEALNIPDENIVWDNDHKGILPTAKKVWSLKTDKPFVMVMNDDAVICKDFMKYVEKIISLHPNHIVSLFPWQFRKRKQVRNRPRPTPYILTKEVMGLAVIMKTEYIKPCLDSWTDDFADDVNITRWAKENDIPILTTLPSIVQHGDYASTKGVEFEQIQTDFFNPDPKDENWDDGYVTAWSNVVAG